jgi:hypothetical protein
MGLGVRCIPRVIVTLTNRNYLRVFRVEVKDISLQDYIQVRHAVFLPHTAGRYAKKQFKKAQMPIVERLVDRYVCNCLKEFVWKKR